MDDENPQEYEMTALLEGVLGLHEVFVTLMRGGFTEDQALKLVANVLHLTGGFNGE
jgi:hypothetical protein